MGLPGGILLSNLVFLLASTVVPSDQFAAWGWRVPFIASALLVAVGMYVRLGIAESPVFAEVLKAGTARRMPVIDVLRTDAKTVLLAAGSYVGISGLGYILLVYFVSYATRQLGLSLPTTLLLVMTASIVGAPAITLFAGWSDRIGRTRIMRWGLAALVLWSMVFFPLVDTRSIPLIALSLSGMLFIQGAYLGPQPAIFAELFPPPIRYSGASLSLTLGTILGGALAPFIATSLYGLAGNSSLVTVYITVMSLISWLCSLGLRETHSVELNVERTL
jgi:MFS family permease